MEKVIDLCNRIALEDKEEAGLVKLMDYALEAIKIVD